MVEYIKTKLTQLRAKFRVKHIKFIFLFLCTGYVFLAVSAPVVSAIYVNDVAGIPLRRNLIDSNCRYISGLLDPNLFRPDQFYLNLNYWLADVKLNEGVLKDQRCIQLLISGMQESDDLVSVAIVSYDKKVVFVLKTNLINH